MQLGRSRVWLVLVLVAAAAAPAAGAPAKKAPAAKAAPAARLTLSATSAKPGDPVLVTVEGVAERPDGTAGKVSLIFFPVRGGWQAVFAIPLDDPPASVTVKVEKELTGTVAIKAHEFPIESATIAPEYAAPPADKHKVVDDDNAKVIAALRNDDPPMWKGRFRRPGPGMATSPFGAWRTFNGDPYKSRHFGQDIGARKGAPVRAAQAGTVTLVHDGYLMGGTVVIVHGAGVASMYIHLDGTAVKVGDKVTAGKVIGKVGLTGRTTGPHIHLGLWVPGGFVDPAGFMTLKLRPLRALPAKKPAK